MPVCKLVSRTTGEQHYASANGDPFIVLNFEYRGRVIIETQAALVDLRGPWMLYVDNAPVYYIPADFEQRLDNVHRCVLLDTTFIFTFGEPKMSLKETEQKLKEARQVVERLEAAVRFAREERINSVVNLLGGSGAITAEEIYEFRNELYDLLDRWYREDL